MNERYAAISHQPESAAIHAHVPRFRSRVIANALHPSNLRSWKMPTPSAFTGQEIRALVDWVWRMSLGGAAHDLSNAFDFSNGSRSTWRKVSFRIVASTIHLHPTPSRMAHCDADRIDYITELTGQALPRTPSGIPLMTISTGMTLVATDFSPATRWQYQHLASRRTP